MLLMKRGGQVIYMGPLGENSNILINYFEVNLPNFLTYQTTKHLS